MTIVSNPHGIGTRFIENHYPNGFDSYTAEFALDASSILSGSGGAFDVLTAYNSKDEEIVRASVWYEESEAKWMTSIYILHPFEGASTWWRTSPRELDPGVRFIRLTWINSAIYNGTSETQGRAKWCVFSNENTSGGCSYQYFYRPDDIALIRLGILRPVGATSGILKMDDFRSWTGEAENVQA